MGELGVLGPTIKGMDRFLSTLCSPSCALESSFLSLSLASQSVKRCCYPSV